MATAPPLSPSNASQTIRLAHTAQCKLHIATNQPDRNLRFLLGHAFTLDQLRLRIAEIDLDSRFDSENETEPEQEQENGSDRKIKFSGSGGIRKEDGGRVRKRSPPPPVSPVPDDKEEEEDVEEDEEEDDGLSLRRFGSGAAKLPRLVGEDTELQEKVEESTTPPPPSPETMLQPSEEDLRAITEGQDNEQWKGIYRRVAGCKCHGQKAPGVERIWEVPGNMSALGKEGRRLAVVQVAA